ncbi:MAG: hypothetical protein AAB887_00360 [Patescibacteria group bacterium]
MRVFFLGPVIVLAALVLASLASRNRLDTEVSGSSYLPLVETRPITFTPIHSGLNIILLRMKNPNLADTSDFVFTLKDQANQTVRELNFSGRNIGDPSDVRLQFTPILDSANQPLTLTIISPSTSVKIENGFRAYYRTSGLSLNLAPLTRDPVFMVVWALLVFGLTRIPADPKSSPKLPLPANCTRRR